MRLREFDIDKHQPGYEINAAGSGLEVLPLTGRDITSTCSVKRDLQPHDVLHVEQGLGISSGVIDGMVGVSRLAQVFERLVRIFDKPLVERPQVL